MNEILALILYALFPYYMPSSVNSYSKNSSYTYNIGNSYLNNKPKSISSKYGPFPSRQYAIAFLAALTILMIENIILEKSPDWLTFFSALVCF